LNPHEIAPASTSKHLTGFCGGSLGRKSLRILGGGFTGLPRISAGPLLNRCKTAAGAGVPIGSVPLCRPRNHNPSVNSRHLGYVMGCYLL
jgi:hypothetical protein